MRKNDGKLLGIAIILQVITFIISMAKVKILANILTVNDFGLYSVLINTMGFLIFAVFFGLDRYLVKEKDKEKREIVLKFLYIILLLSSAVTFLVITLLKSQFNKTIVMFIISTILLGVSQINRFYIYAKNSIKKYNYLGFIMNNGWAFFLIGFYIIEKPNILSLNLLFIFMIIGSLLSIIYSANEVPINIIKKRINYRVIRGGLKYSIPLLPTIYANFILRLADKYTLMFLADSTALANYNVALSIMNIVIAFVTVCIEIYKPRIIQENDELKVKGYITSSVILVLMISLPAATMTMIFSDNIVLLFSSSKYLGASKIMLLTTILSLVISMLSVNVSISERKNNNKNVFKAYVKGTVLNIFLNIVLVYLLGVYGAVLAGIVSYIYIFLFISKKNKFLGFIIIRNIKPIISVNIIFLVLALVINSFKLNFILSILILGIIYFFLVVALNKNFIYQLFRRQI